MIINRGKKAHNFVFLGKTIVLASGHKAHFFRGLLAEAPSRYRSTTDPGKAFRGVFPVD